jgi:5-methylcytosine-specific restriction endonuclease McrA
MPTTAIRSRADAQDFRVLMRSEGIPVRSRKPKFRRRGRCQKCGVHNSIEQMTVDHIVPQCRLRSHPRIRNHAANKQTLCAPCNNGKGDGAAIDYRNDKHLYDLLNRLLAQAGLNIKVFQAISG